MREFPDSLNVKEKDKFPNIYNNRVLCYLRKSIYEHVISQDENSYFDLEKFVRTYYKDSKDIEKLQVNLVIQELEEIGWKCKLSFGGTALFIYSTLNPPSSCWDDGL